MRQPRCPDCGRFCGVVVRSAGPSTVERPSCTYCGNNLPKCAAEDGSCFGCHIPSTHVEQVSDSRKRYWCEEHAPDDAEPLPYYEDDDESDDESGVTVTCSVCGEEIGKGPGGLGLFQHSAMHRREYKEQVGSWPMSYQDVRDVVGRTSAADDPDQTTLWESLTDDEQASLSGGKA